MITLALRKIKPLSRIPVLPMLLNPGLTECEDGRYPGYLKTKRYSCRIEGNALGPFTVLRVNTIDCRKTASDLQDEQRFMEKLSSENRQHDIAQDLILLILRAAPGGVFLRMKGAVAAVMDVFC